MSLSFKLSPRKSLSTASHRRRMCSALNQLHSVMIGTITRWSCCLNGTNIWNAMQSLWALFSLWLCKASGWLCKAAASWRGIDDVCLLLHKLTLFSYQIQIGNEESHKNLPTKKIAQLTTQVKNSRQTVTINKNIHRAPRQLTPHRHHLTERVQLQFLYFKFFSRASKTCFRIASICFLGFKDTNNLFPIIYQNEISVQAILSAVKASYTSVSHRETTLNLATLCCMKKKGISCSRRVELN